MKFRHYIILAFIALLTACSTTSHLPEGEVLYTGVDRIEHKFLSDTSGVEASDPDIQDAVATTLEVLPNSAFLGSAYKQSKMPWGLWIYNSWYPKDSTGFRHWFWSKFKSEPTLVSMVNPALRAQAAEAALRDEGYFSANVLFDTVPNAKNPRKAKLAYQINYGGAHKFGPVDFRPSESSRIDSILTHTKNASFVQTGKRFSVINLESERERIASVLWDSGYFFFKPEYVKYMGDTLLKRGEVAMRVITNPEADRKAWAPCVIDSVLFTLDYGAGLKSQNFDTVRNMVVGYNGPKKINSRVLRRTLGFRRGALYNPEMTSLISTKLARLNTFKYTTTEFQVLRFAGDTIAGSPLHQDTTHLRLKINATYDYPWSGSVEIGVVHKDNDQIGPGVTLTATKRNLFGGGEALSFQTRGSYEWRTVRDGSDSYGGLVNAFELGGKVTLTVPRLQLPRRMFKVDREKPVTTRYSLSLDWMRRAGLFEMVKATGQVDYSFYRTKKSSFTITPIKLSFVSITKQTENFRVQMSLNDALANSFSNQFIPQIQFSWLYDNSSLKSDIPGVSKRMGHYLNITAAEAGGLCDLAMGWWGTHKIQGERQILDRKFSQFLKGTIEYRNTYKINNSLTLASRFLGGVAWAYGNSSEMPYSEVFFIGGPNSLRGFSVRGVGPGHREPYDMPYSYLYNNGDIKLEVNTELRFPIAGMLQGAMFIDAGNVWRFSPEDVLELVVEVDEKTGEKYVSEIIEYSDYDGTIQHMNVNSIAWNTGLGLRLDLGMLILRLDAGIPMHDPGRRGKYFNCFDSFWKNLGLNLAVGYPF